MSHTFTDSKSSGELGYNGFPVSLNYFTALPDVSVLHNPHLVVIFKSLMKKDSTTKEKSLNEFIQLFQDQDNDEYLKDDLLIMSWIQLYPKLAIDNSRNVRVQVHEVQANFLQKVGGKTFSKYFKSCIPIWLHGLFDVDKIVANACYKSLLKSLQDDKSNIDKLWLIFYKPVINFIMTTICLEDHESLSDQRYTKEDDSRSKYERVVNGSVSMLIKLIDIIKSGSLSLENNEEELANILNILSSERLWEFLGKSISGEHINISLFRTLISLITKIFEKDGTSINKFASSLTDLKSIYKDISKKFIKNVKIKINSKSSNSNLIYRNAVLPLWNCLVILTDFSNLSDSEKKQFKIKKNFWELGGSKSYSRLLEYLKLGYCHLEPIYYSIVSKFFETLKEVSLDSEEFLEFDSRDDAENIIVKILCKQIKSLPNNEIRFSCIEASFRILKLFLPKIEDPGNSILKILIYTLVDSISKTTIKNSDIDRMQNLSNLLDDTVVTSESDILEGFNTAIVQSIFKEESLGFEIDSYKFTSPETSLIENYFILLSNMKGKESSVKLSQDILQNVNEGGYTNSSLLFRVISLLIEYKLADDETIKDFVECAPSFIEEDFIEEPLLLLNQVLEFNLKDSIDLNELIDNYFIKLSITKTHLPEFLNIVIKHKKLDKEIFPDIFTYLSGLSLEKDINDDELDVLLHFFNDQSISSNLIDNFIGKESSRLRLIQNLSSKSIDIESLLSDEYYSSLLLSAWSNIELGFCKDFILNSSKKDLVRLTSLSFICTSQLTDFSSILDFFDENMVPCDDMFDILIKSSKNLRLDYLSIGNPLEFNTYLLEPFSKDKGKLDKVIIRIGDFLSQFIQKKGTFKGAKLIILCSFISEFISDYIFLENESDVPDTEGILQIKDILYKCIGQNINDFTLEDALVIVNDDIYLDTDISYSIVSELNKLCTGDSIEGFYAARVLKVVLDQLSVDESIQWFENLDINFNKFISNPIKLSVLLLHFSRFVSKSSKFDRLRNYVAAEIIGVTKDTNILTDGLKWLTLSLNFLNLDVPFEAIPPHRLMMVLNQISKWMDSEITYEEEFVVMRTQLSRFYACLVSNYSSLPDKFWELCTQLVVDNLSLIGSDPEYANYLELRYTTLKLFLVVSKSNTIPEVWLDERDSMTEEVMTIFLSSDVQMIDSKLNNQPVSLNHQLLIRVFEVIKFPINFLNKHIDEFYSLLSNSTFVNLQRILTDILHRLIVRNQEDVVVEYQLRKSNLGDDDSEEELSFELPQALLDNINQDVLEVEHMSTSFKYLWSWILVFDHFKDVTYSLRESYVSQLKKSHSIDLLLDTIFDHLDVTDKDFLQKLSPSNSDLVESIIPMYEVKYGCPGESPEFESKFILVHLYYLSFLFLGSHVQTWFKAIRDLQLKLKIENFSKRFITPIIIKNILNEVSTSKDKISSKVDNMTIKVNSVTNEIKSEFLIDEKTMQMTIKIPETYPLANVTVEGPLRVGVKENRWKAWLMSSQRIISLSNGSILESIELFSKNVNLHFEGFEDCAICYSILHQDNSLPSKVCPTCLNKFHAACLYKWFKSSGASTCPLCRSTFNFRRSRSANP